MYILYSATLEASPSHDDGSTTVCHRPGSKDHLASAFESNYAWQHMLLLLSLLIDFTEAFRGTKLTQCLWWPTNLNLLLLCSHRTQSDCYDVAREREALHRQVEELEAANAAADSELRPLKQTAHILRQRVFGPSSHPSLPGLPSYAVSLTHQHLWSQSPRRSTSSCLTGLTFLKFGFHMNWGVNAAYCSLQSACKHVHEHYSYSNDCHRKFVAYTEIAAFLCKTYRCGLVNADL